MFLIMEEWGGRGSDSCSKHQMGTRLCGKVWCSFKSHGDSVRWGKADRYVSEATAGLSLVSPHLDAGSCPMQDPTTACTG